jgi:hypothetical protein
MLVKYYHRTYGDGFQTTLHPDTKEARAPDSDYSDFSFVLRHKVDNAVRLTIP